MADRAPFHGPTSINTPGWQVQVATDRQPLLYDQYRDRADLVEELDIDRDGRYFFVAASPPGAPWPSIVVAMHYSPDVGGFEPGVAITENCLFVAAGDRAICYSGGPPWRQLWAERLPVGFWAWAVHGEVVVMAGELTFAAWDVAGRKLWSTFVEPPWSYEITDDRVALDVMGTLSTFDMHAGPS